MRKVKWLIAIMLSFLSEVWAQELKGELQNIALFKTDSDFDPSKPVYLPSGQTVGALGTFMRPELTIKPVEKLKVFYEVEIGLNIWSRNSLEIEPGRTRDLIMFKHRQIYSEGEIGRTWFRVGYQHICDPTRLFIEHWLGALKVSVSGWSFILGQLPDQTYEGWDLNRNNFTHDVFVLGAKKEVGRKKVGIFGLYDGETIGRPKFIISPSISIGEDFGFDLALQAGMMRKGAYDGDEIYLGGALQGFTHFKRGRKELAFNLFVLSPDDRYDRNGWNFAFHYSGKTRSRTIILTEDEIRDRGDNMDERISRAENNFFVARSGFALLDGSLSYKLRENLTSTLTVGVAATLLNKNSLGEHFVGAETNLIVEYSRNNVSLVMANGVIVPGGVASASFNTVDMEKARPIYMLEISLNVAF